MKRFFFKTRKKYQPQKIPVIRGHCKKCGNCCRQLNICEEGKWVATSRHFKQILKESPEYERFEITGKNKNGSLNFKCTWLNEDGTCKDYTNRLDICRDFPDSMAIMNQGVLPDGCGFEIYIENSFEYILQKTVQQEKRKHFWNQLKNGLLHKTFLSKIRISRKENTT
jgi:hypothetical protein